ncbi:hypothetical protein HOE04_01310 [archaeon]|jgi:hypothetical protein|nr:hypothetical protein [archaeon]
MKTPKTQIYITGEQVNGYNQITKFFDSIIKEKIKLPKNHPHIELRVRGMYRLENEAKTDECTHMLLYKEKVVATVIETRTDNNYVQFNFFQNLERLLG